jgi:hypothetical protein
MTSTGWFCLGFGTCLGLLIILAGWVDVLFIRAGEATISHRCLVVGQRWPIMAVFVTAILITPVAILIGHLFFGQHE